MGKYKKIRNFREVSDKRRITNRVVNSELEKKTIILNLKEKNRIQNEKKYEINSSEKKIKALPTKDSAFTYRKNNKLDNKNKEIKIESNENQFAYRRNNKLNNKASKEELENSDNEIKQIKTAKVRKKSQLENNIIDLKAKRLQKKDLSQSTLTGKILTIKIERPNQYTNYRIRKQDTKDIKKENNPYSEKKSNNLYFSKDEKDGVEERKNKKINTTLRGIKNIGKSISYLTNDKDTLNNEDLTVEAFRKTGRLIERSDRVIRDVNRSVKVAKKLGKSIKSVKEYCRDKKSLKEHKNEIISLKKELKISQKTYKDLNIKDIMNVQVSKKKAEKTAFQKKIKKKKYYIRLQESYKKIAISVSKVKQTVALALKNPKVLVPILSVGLIIILLTAVFSSINSLMQTTITVVPNIENAQEWINAMNEIENNAIKDLNSGDRTKRVDKGSGDWKDAIAICMVKYDYEPPIGSNLSFNTPQGSGETVGNSSTETTFTGSYVEVIKLASEKYNVDTNLIAAVITQESGFNPMATSPVGAMGLMQLMPATAADLGVINAYDPYQNIMGGTKLLSQLSQKYNGNLELILAGYNAGSGNVDKYGGVPPFAETQQYVVRVSAYYQSYKDGMPIPDGQITGSMTSGSSIGCLSSIYSKFNSISQRVDYVTHTHTDDDGNEVTETEEIIVMVLTTHDMEYVMDSMGFDEDQKERAREMRKADMFSEVIPDFNFNFRI